MLYQTNLRIFGLKYNHNLQLMLMLVMMLQLNIQMVKHLMVQ